MGEAEKEPRKFYFDSCLFIDLLERNPDRLPVLEALFEECEKTNIAVYTSHLTIVEVAYLAGEKSAKRPVKDLEQKLDILWRPPSKIRMVEVHELIVREARKLIRDQIETGFSLKPHDAIHIATARSARTECLYTYDDKLFKYSKTDLSIKAPEFPGDMLPLPAVPALPAS